MEKDFERTDAELMKRLESLRKTPLPPKALDGFSASVEARIRERETVRTRSQREPGTVSWRVRSWAPVWAPAFAVMFLASVVALRSGWQTPSTLNGHLTVPADAVQLASNTVSVADEVAALRELGVWTDEDEAAIGGDTATLEEIELSQNAVVSAVV